MAKLGFRSQLVLVFLSAIVIRLAIFYGTSMPTGDVGQFATFVREISENNGRIPEYNTLYFPGSRFIYPPLIFVSIANLNIVLGHLFTLPSNLAIYELFYLTVLVSSAQASFLYWYISKNQGKIERLVIAVSVVLFSVSLYLMSWGGYPDIIATFMLLLLLYLLEERRDTPVNIAYASILVVLIAFTHDLTYFFTMLTLFGIIVFYILKRRFGAARKVLPVFVAGMIAGAIWWIPRIYFVLDAFSVTEARGTGPFPIITPTIALLQVIPYIVPVIILLAIEVAAAYKQKGVEPVDTFTIALFCTLSAFIFLIRDPDLSARLVIYSYTLVMVILLKNLKIIKKTSIFKGRWIDNRKRATALVLAFVAVSAPVQLYLSSGSVQFFNSGQYHYDQELIDYGASHFQNGTVIAPQIGTYLSAMDGSPVVVYTGLIVGQVQLEERNAAVSLILHSTAPGTFQNISKYNFRYVVIMTSVVNQTVSGSLITFPAPDYVFVGHFGEYSLYRINSTLPLNNG